MRIKKIKGVIEWEDILLGIFMLVILTIGVHIHLKNTNKFIKKHYFSKKTDLKTDLFVEKGYIIYAKK